MKKSNKFFSVVLAVVLVLAMAIPAFAAADGTIIIDNAVKDHTYTIYQMLSFTPTSENADEGIYTIVSGWENFFSGETAAAYFAVADNKVTLKEGVTAVDATLAKAAIAYAKENSITATGSQTATAETVTFSSLDLGYYAVDTTLGTICSLTNTSTTAKAYEKNSVPSLVKKIVEGEELVDANNVAIGDTVTYQATITVGDGAENYVMHDKMSDGLTYKAVSSVKVDAAEVDAANYTLSTESLADGCDFEISFNNEYVATLAEGTEIIVTYTAELNSNAVVGTTGNPNEAWLEYGDNTDTEKTYTTVPDVVITYTAKLTVYKTDKDGKALSGAGFTLYKDGVQVGEEITDTTTFVWTGLEEGTYKLVETTVPAGYNKAEDIEFTITCIEPTEVAEGTETATWSSSNIDVTYNTTDNTFETSVKNLTGSVLPETGGIGTTIFYIVGGLLVVGAVILLITKKRMSAEA